ncbi:hypothetical protein HKH61_004790 [Escherichia coli]|nr:hypothetical protein [Escherichia coli]
MAITFHPKKKQILICDFKGSVSPEINQCRPVLILREEIVGSQKLVVVVPISNTEPNPLCSFHHELDDASPSLSGHMMGKKHWAKCDLVSTVSVDRLDRIRSRDPRTGKNYFHVGVMTDDDFDAVRDKVMYGIGFDDFLDVKNEGVPDGAAASVVIAAEVNVAEVEKQKKAI